MDIFIKNINGLVGKKCWGVVAGESTGSIMSIYFGEKYLRKDPIPNKFLSSDCQNYDAEYSFLIYSPWRVNNSTDIISASYFNNSNNGPMLEGLNKLLGLKILEVLCNPPNYDIKIMFENDIVLDVFACDIDIEVDGCFYSFSTPNGCFSVGEKSSVELDNQ